MKKAALFLALLLTISTLSLTFNVKAQNTVQIEFTVEQAYWGRYNNPTRPAPGDQNVPLTIIVRQHSDFYLRGIDGYLNLTAYNGSFLDHVDRDMKAYSSATRIDTEPDTDDIVPYGSFYFTFYLDINESVRKGYYTFQLLIKGYAKNTTGYYEIVPVVLNVTVYFPNQPPVIHTYSPSEDSVTIYVGDNQTFSVNASDPDGDNITISWVLDDRVVGHGYNYTLVATEDMIGSHTLRAEVSDGTDKTIKSWSVTIDENRMTTVRASQDYIYAGYKNFIKIRITNNVWKGTVTVELSYPEYMTVIGNTSWKFTGIQPGDTIQLNVTLYAPVKVVAGVYGEIYLIGQTATLTVSIHYTDYHGRSFDEDHDIGLIIRGRQIIRVYDVHIAPNPVTPGKILEVSGIILNMGSYKALYANVSIMPIDVLDLSYSSFYYIGDIDVNMPIPFTLTAFVKLNATPGTYNLTIVLYYQDDQYNEYYLNITTSFNITKEVEQPQKEELTIQAKMAFYSAIAGIIAIVAAYLYIRRKRAKFIGFLKRFVPEVKPSESESQSPGGEGES